ncbi:hypothetical protein [Frondihabitans australicus]|uniref:Uncharacterized protein n=1 Tax=Frondihabitans australicus TaxID=386892 RepID=A0A495IDQ1_9MICO|nr:hypothetical protein [Frondihabitans australicus]RKR73770.1 hypothetical protein C8E83_0866 [Frondihabitans australicus]
MPTKAHDEEAIARDAEVADMHPGVERHHVRATFPARIVLRAVEKEETGHRELPVVGESYLTAVVVDGSLIFYAGVAPTWRVASIETSRVTGITTATEPVIEPEVFAPLLRITLAEPGADDLDLDLELWDFDGVALHRVLDIATATSQWGALLGL